MQQGEPDQELAARAREMAASGLFPSWRLIEIELRFMEGRREAAALFTDPELRAALDAACRKAWQPPAPVPAAPFPAAPLPPGPLVAAPHAPVEAVPPPEADLRPRPVPAPAPVAPMPAARRPYRPLRAEAPRGRKYQPA